MPLIRQIELGPVAQSNACPTGNHGVAVLYCGPLYSFVGIDREIFSAVILILQLNQEG